MRAAFTLLETVIVLAIVAFLMLMTLPSAEHSKQKIAERQFWSDLRTQWQAAQTRAKVKHQITFIEPQDESKIIDFYWVDENGDATVSQAYVKLPPTLVLDSFPDTRMNENGFVNPATARFHSTLDNKKYEMRIQLGWGGFHIVEKVQKSLFAS